MSSLSYRVIATCRRGRNFYRRRTARTVSTSPPLSDATIKSLDFIPKPTWSIQSLDLTSKHDKLPREELERLSHLALLDLNQLPDHLEQDLANMMHMVQQVSDFVRDNPALFEEYDDETGTLTYDFVRGVTAAPLRDSTECTDSELQDDETEAARVWESYLEANTVLQGGAHKYFSITTKSD